MLEPKIDIEKLCKLQLQANELIITLVKTLIKRIDAIDKNQDKLWGEVFDDKETPTGLGLVSGTNDKRWRF